MMGVRLFAIKTRAEMGLSEEEYKRGRRLYFGLKYRLFPYHFLIGFTACAAFYLFAFSLALAVKGWDLPWSSWVALPWGKFAALGLVLSLLGGAFLAVGYFLWGTPIPPSAFESTQKEQDG